jgi:hypothetical protein
MVVVDVALCRSGARCCVFEELVALVLLVFVVFDVVIDVLGHFSDALPGSNRTRKSICS